MHAFAVFLTTYITSVTVFVYSYHAFLARASLGIVALYVVVVGCAFGVLGGYSRWARTHTLAFVSGSFSAGITIILPFALVTYGFALRAFPLVMLWIAMNSVGYIWSSLRFQRATREEPNSL